MKRLKYMSIPAFLILIVIIGKSKVEPPKGSNILPSAVKLLDISPNNDLQTGPTNIPSIQELQIKNQEIQNSPTQQVAIPAMTDPLELRSRQFFEEFENKAAITFTPPEKLHFTSLDLTDNNLIGTFGYSADSQTGLAVIASNKAVSDATVREFLDNSSDEIPSLKNKRVSWLENKETLVSPIETGVEIQKIWIGKDESGNNFAAVLLPRIDKKGTYLFIYNTPVKNVFENEGYHDKLLSEIRVHPL